MMRWTRFAATAVIALAVVAGPPAALTVWALHARPDITSSRLRAWVTDPPPEALLTVLLAVAILGLWGLCATLILRALAHHARRVWQRLRRLPMPTSTQVAASSLAGTAVLGLPAALPADTPAPVTHTTGSTTPPGPPGTSPSTTASTAGVTLPDGGWIPHHDAEQIAAMLGLYWLRRRQTHQLGQPAPPAQVPTAATATASWLNEHEPPRPDAVDPDRFPAGVLTLRGPGAHDAARGLLVTTLMTNTTVGRPHAHVHLTSDDYRTLLGPTALTAVPGLHLHDRSGDLSTAPTEANDARDLVLTTQRPSVAPPRQTNTTTVVFDDPSATSGPTWTVDADGTVTGRTATRLCVLPAATAADLLNLISRTHQPPPPTEVPPAAAVLPLTVTRDPENGRPRPAQLTVLGQLRLEVNSGPLHLRRNAAWQVLTLLALHPDGMTGRDLTNTIWPGLPPATITGRLHTTIAELRSTPANTSPRPC
ncbi:hypothetical protein [Actinoplanes sp. NPDC051494]|uniref:hypothetical protein n=1 Tax=Actinoplanes sp. NPDC051494 TaxID=3363907 RepID=UPI0037899BE6